MRFHVISLPHTNTTLEFTSCAFTEKVRRFCIMMKDMGHEVFLYAGEFNSAPVTEHIECISEAERLESLNDNHYTTGSFDSSLVEYKLHQEALQSWRIYCLGMILSLRSYYPTQFGHEWS